VAHAFAAEYKALYSISGNSDDAVIDSILGHIEAQILRHTGGVTYVNTSEVTETNDHTGKAPYFYTRKRPIQSVTTIHQNSSIPRAFDADALVDADTYDNDDESGKIMYLADGKYWLRGFKTTQVVYTPGYAAVANVPEDLVRLLLEWARASHVKTEQRRHGVRSTNAGDGSTNYEISRIPIEVTAILDLYTNLATG